MRILLVDDDPDVRETLAEALALAGHSIHDVGSGAEALRCLIKTPNFDLMVLDLRMPGLDGWDLLRLRRSVDEVANVPTILITGVTTTEFRRAAIGADVSLVFSKPVQLDQLLRAIDHIGVVATAAPPASAEFECPFPKDVEP